MVSSYSVAERRGGGSPFRCPVCGNRKSVTAVFRDPAAIRTIIACLVTHGRSPPNEG
ncbi:MAG: hypothetical protein NT005_16075 [Spirochaetes bacterium]|nr:hypothetical protein [Spirochaetota bacterium]